ncbi:hypothetical protein R80B4_01765 [Fibrobacteres bacterium R8-0-B4]
MPRNEAQTRYELIDPVLKERGWNGSNTKVEATTPGGIIVEEFKLSLARQLIASAATLDEFRTKWINPAERNKMIDDLVSSGYAPEMVRQVEKMTEYDLYDVLADIAYDATRYKQTDRVVNFRYKQRAWLDTMPEQTKTVILAIVAQFGREGSDVFENPQLFNVEAIQKAGGMAALNWNGGPGHLMMETKRRLFAA